MQISIDRNGNRLVSVTKPERKKLTDALEFLAIVETNLGSSAAAAARESIRRVFKDLDNAVAATPKPTQATTVAEVSNENPVAAPAVVASGNLEVPYTEIESCLDKAGQSIKRGSNVTFIDENGHTIGGVVTSLFTRVGVEGSCWGIVDTDSGKRDVHCSSIVVD